MKLLVLSYKIGWQQAQDFVTYAGFPFQMEAISSLFEETTISLLIRSSPVFPGARKINGHNIKILPLPEPTGSDFRRKLTLIAWLPRYLPVLWMAVRRADVVHTPVPGDIGSIGLILALLQRKPLFVRHCGTWGEPITISDRILLWLLERIAGGRNVVLATGGAQTPPSPKNPQIHWIFSTSLTQRELDEITPAPAWDGRSPLRLVTVGRVTSGKNMAAIIKALPDIRAVYPQTTLDILGDGNAKRELEQLARSLNLQNSVIFHGNVGHADVLEILMRSHLFVFPTRTKEGFPKAVLEALACGLPVVATRVSVIPHLLKNGSGRLLDDTSAPAVSNAILDLLADHPQFPMMSRLARESAQGYTLEAWGAAIGEHLQKAWGQLRGTTES